MATVKTLQDLDIEEGKYLIEIKIDKDIKDYQRMGDELRRSSQRVGMKHIIYVSRFPDFDAWKVMVTLAHRYGARPHHVYWLERQDKIMPYYTSNLIDSVKKIIRGHYDNERGIVKAPSSKLNPFARMLASFNGITEENAIKLADKYVCLADLRYGITETDKFDAFHFNGVFGMNKDGSEKAIVRKFRDFWEGN